MRHITVENIMDYVDGLGKDVEKLTFETHLEDCRECSELKQEFQALVTQLRQDSSFEPPAEVVQWGINLFQPVMQPEREGLRKIIAAVVFDTFDQPLLAGVRRVGTPPRQLLFRAGDVDVD